MTAGDEKIGGIGNNRGQLTLTHTYIHTYMNIYVYIEHTKSGSIPMARVIEQLKRCCCCCRGRLLQTGRRSTLEFCNQATPVATLSAVVCCNAYGQHCKQQIHTYVRVLKLQQK